MTIDRDLDRRLVDLFEDRSVAVPPPDLLARSLARVDSTGQRRTWRFPSVALRGDATFGHPLLPAWALLVLVALVAVALLVVGSQIVRRYQSVIPEQTPPALAVYSTPSPETQAPIETRPPGVPAEAGMFATIRDVFAAGDQVAWVSTKTAIYRTDDTGKTWRAVQPDGWALPNDEAFLDADTAYVPIGTGSEIAVTHDGGASWSTSVLDAGGAGSPVFAFASASTGYVTFVDPSHYDKRDGTGLFVFGTTDGGRTWTGPSRGLQPHLKASSNKLYGAKGAFLINSAGLSDQYAFENFFDLSEDGGATYTRYDFPVGPLAPKKAMKEVVAIVRGLDGHLLIALGVDGSPEVVYRNGGYPSTWSQVDEVPTGIAQPFQFLSPTSWVFTAGAPGEILSTIDAGAHWRTVVPSISLYGVQAGEGPASWGSLETGWGVEECRWTLLSADGSPGSGRSCGDRPHDIVLLVTSDGGATWTRIGS
ncbi:MAG: hypothetical protein E6G61_06130 [Actinobacteria bacterium]|nr:MAG: hypothetical protein E6G61_06130 [Actinomycetota bacterium]